MTAITTDQETCLRRSLEGILNDAGWCEQVLKKVLDARHVTVVKGGPTMPKDAFELLQGAVYDAGILAFSEWVMRLAAQIKPEKAGVDAADVGQVSLLKVMRQEDFGRVPQERWRIVVILRNTLRDMLRTLRRWPKLKLDDDLALGAVPGPLGGETETVPELNDVLAQRGALLAKKTPPADELRLLAWARDWIHDLLNPETADDERGRRGRLASKWGVSYWTAGRRIYTIVLYLRAVLKLYGV
jgi:DNA-directed RNA polymerase specialized sigma24 family protein